MRQIASVNAERSALMSPDEVHQRFPLNEAAEHTVHFGRARVTELVAGKDPRLLAIVGPCSIHDPRAALDYANRLAGIKTRFEEELVVLMRVYLEKPRTGLGWKGLVNDPKLDGTHDLGLGILTARSLLSEITSLGMPVATEVLDPLLPLYLGDLVSWAAIGARTAQSPTHRELASGLAMPVGFKNGTDGALGAAINGMRVASESHSSLGVGQDGRVSSVRTAGNPHTHLVLRGGESGPNHHAEAVARAASELVALGLNPRVLVDCSHGNSGKDHRKQAHVIQNLARQLEQRSPHLLGVMLESNLVAGKQELTRPPAALKYGLSVTDACIDLVETERLLSRLARAWRGSAAQHRASALALSAC